MNLSDVVDEFLDQYGFPKTCSSKESNFSSLNHWRKQIDNFDTSFQDFSFGTLVFEGWRFAMDRICFRYSYGRSFIDRLTHDVDDTIQGLFAHRHGDLITSLGHFLSATQAI